VRKSSSAEEALLLCQTIRPDVIVSDIRMGEMNGFELLERLKVIDALKDIPFVFLTSLDESRSKQKGLSLGAAAYMTKPFDIDDLLERIRKLVPPQ
jgi:sigma-B regulation protein RsbU (phosphoserine phosphatase)